MPRFRFSVIITSHNQSGFIRDAVDSVLKLTNPTPEVVVVDDGSTDGSQQVLAGYGDAIRLVALSTNLGKGGARNAGAAASTGDYLIFLDGDDALMPWTLQVYERIVQDRAPKLLLCSMFWFKDTLPSPIPMRPPREINLVEYADFFRKDRSFEVSASSMIIERGAFDAVHGWALERFVMQDWELLLRLGLAGKTVQILSPPTVLHRQHAAQPINKVAPYIDVMFQFLRQEQAGGYPGGQERRSERRAMLGRLALYWGKQAIDAGLYGPALKLFARTWPLIVEGTIRRMRDNAGTGRYSETVRI